MSSFWTNIGVTKCDLNGSGIKKKIKRNKNKKKKIKSPVFLSGHWHFYSKTWFSGKSYTTSFWGWGRALKTNGFPNYESWYKNGQPSCFLYPAIEKWQSIKWCFLFLSLTICQQYLSCFTLLEVIVDVWLGSFSVLGCTCSLFFSLLLFPCQSVHLSSNWTRLFPNPAFHLSCQSLYQQRLLPTWLWLLPGLSELSQDERQQYSRAIFPLTGPNARPQDSCFCWSWMMASVIMLEYVLADALENKKHLLGVN